MKTRSDIMISYEDRILWEKVAATVQPLKGRAAPASDDGPHETMESLTLSAPLLEKTLSNPSLKPIKPANPVRLDNPTTRKIAKGKLSLSARIDLHGLTQAEAHGLLLAFLHKAYAQGLRHILIITGKGASFGSDGVLRQAVPHWFATPAFRPFVGAYEDAARHHGGSGALYVRLRRKTELEHFPAEWNTKPLRIMRQNKELERRFDSTKSENALSKL